MPPMSQPLPKPGTASPDSAACRKGRGWLAAVLPVAVITACSELGIAVLNNSALPVYFTKGLKIDTAIYAVLMVPFFLSEVLFKSPLGALGDRYGRKPLIVGGALVTTFTPLLLISIHYHPRATLA